MAAILNPFFRNLKGWKTRSLTYGTAINLPGRNTRNPSGKYKMQNDSLHGLLTKTIIGTKDNTENKSVALALDSYKKNYGKR
jgi:hypothetical protein